MKLLCIVALLALSITTTFAFYLPGVAPREYEKGDDVLVKVMKLDSSHTQIPFPYYALPFCRPKQVKDKKENLGEILMGDRIENSLYTLSAKEDESCKFLCEKELSVEDLQLFSDRIDEEYRAYWILDNLPAATRKSLIDPNSPQDYYYENGFSIGRKGTEQENGKEGDLYLNNHLNLRILYHEDPEVYQGARIVGFEVEPFSIGYSDKESIPSLCGNYGPETPALKVNDFKSSKTVYFTYSVEWIKDTRTRWASRWDVYLLMTDDQIHWFSIINSLMIVLFLTGMVAMIMMRTLHADFRRYKDMENQAEAQEETGWKLVHGDVFRPPQQPMLLAVLVGTGVQTFAMAVITMIFAVLGFLSPANRGGLLTAMVVLFVFMGIFAGFFSARIYKMFKGQQWKKCMLMTAFLVPGAVFGIFFILDVILFAEGSSGAVPFRFMVAIIALWFCISTPLVFFGSYFGFKKPVEDPPVRTNQIPRQIPEQVWYMKPAVSVLIGGILPFGAVFIELFFILSSVWLHQFYYIFGFLSIVFIILILTCAEITIVMCYFQLCSEDYHWWWRSFLTSGASALYMFLYSTFYFFTNKQLHIVKFVSVLLYYGYTMIFTAFFFCLTGAIGFYSCFIFVKKIYSVVKVD